MSERMVVYAGENLDWIEVNGMPQFVDDRALVLTAPPARFAPSDVLVWSQRNNTRFIFIGELADARLDGTDRVLLRFRAFRSLGRPVVVYDGADDELPDGTSPFNDGKGFCNDFSYISEETYASVLKEAARGAPR